eukprot:403333940
MIEIPFASELKNGEMKPLKVGPLEDDLVLIAKHNGKLHSIGNYCTHFGAPLHTGTLYQDKVFCPWHSASFSIENGFIDGAPGLDGVPKYEVVEKGTQHFVNVPETIKKNEQPYLAKRNPQNKSRYVVIGGGPAGLSCAETLRQAGFTGEISLVSAESIAPYDRTGLSKAIGSGSAFSLRDQAYLREADIDMHLNSRVTRVDSQNKTLTIQQYASGTYATKPPIKGIDLQNVYLLRDHLDQTNIKEKALNAQSIAIIGAGFIGSESAAALKMQYGDKKQIHLIHADQVPMQRQFGLQVGQALKNQHEQNGVSLNMNKMVVEILSDDGKNATGVLLNDGSIIKSDLVIIGAGVLPSTQFLNNTGLNLDDKGAIFADSYLQTNHNDIFAAGDAVVFPYPHSNQKVRIEHYITAMDQGAFAAFNMLGLNKAYNRVPFFWTRHYNQSIQYVGYATAFDEVHVQGNVEKGEPFIAYYIQNDKVLAASGLFKSDAIMTCLEALQRNY